MTQRVIWTPQPGPQTLLVQCPLPDLFYGGAAGGGKTDGFLGDFAIHAGLYGHAARGVFFRRSLPELEDVEARAVELYRPLGATYNVQRRIFEFPPDGNGQGARLRLRYLDRDEDAAAYQGHAYTREYFDEVGNFPSHRPIDFLWARLRSAHGVPTARRLGGNPGGPGHVWLKRRYIDPYPQGLRPFRYRPQPELRPNLQIEAVFIPAKLEDNLILMQQDPEYESKLAAAGDANLFRAWRYGDWSVIAGAVFAEWRPDLHIAHSFRVPQHWAWGAGLDWGYRSPGCFVLFACSPDGDVIAVREDYFNAGANKEHAGQVGYRIGLWLREYPPLDYIASDEAMWQKTGTSAPTMAEEFQNGLIAAFGGRADQAPRLVEATHGRGSRVVKVQLMHRYLGWKAESDGSIKPWHRPLLRFQEACTHCIETIPALPYDPTNAEDVDTRAEDHAFDAVTYFLMSRPPLPDALPKPVPRDQHPGITRGGKRRRPSSAPFEDEADAPIYAGAGPWRLARPGELEPQD